MGRRSQGKMRRMWEIVRGQRHNRAANGGVLVGHATVGWTSRENPHRIGPTQSSAKRRRAGYGSTAASPHRGPKQALKETWSQAAYACRRRVTRRPQPSLCSCMAGEATTLPHGGAHQSSLPRSSRTASMSGSSCTRPDCGHLASPGFRLWGCKTDPLAFCGHAACLSYS